MARSCYRVSNTIGDGAAIAVSSLFGGANIFVNCFIASFITIPCCRNGVAGCNVVLVILQLGLLLLLLFPGIILLYLLFWCLLFPVCNCWNSGSVSLPVLCSILLLRDMPMPLFPLVFHGPLLYILVVPVVFCWSQSFPILVGMQIILDWFGMVITYVMSLQPVLLVYPIVLLESCCLFHTVWQWSDF